MNYQKLAEKVMDYHFGDWRTGAEIRSDEFCAVLAESMAVTERRVRLECLDYVLDELGKWPSDQTRNPSIWQLKRVEEKMKEALK